MRRVAWLVLKVDLAVAKMDETVTVTVTVVDVRRLGGQCALREDIQVRIGRSRV